MKKSKIKNYFIMSKGITLIALIITIIVMLILAAVSINIAVNGGLFNYAGKASLDYRMAQEQETIFQSLSEWQMEKIISGDTTVFSEYIENRLKNEAKEIELLQDDKLKIELDSGNQYIIADNVEYIGESVSGTIPKGGFYCPYGTIDDTAGLGCRIGENN